MDSILDLVGNLRKAVYFPIERGLYEVAPGMRSLATDFGNAEADQKCFQIDLDYPRYIFEKRAARLDDRADKYIGFDRLDDGIATAACRFLLQTAVNEYPEFFKLSGDLFSGCSLDCVLTGENFVFDSDMKLLSATTRTSIKYLNSFDAMMSQFQEDAAIVSLDSTSDWLSALHVSMPSHWDPRKKLGKSFLQVHAPVPGFEKIARAHRPILDAMVNKGPFVRFVWSFVTDTRLNHHSEPPSGEDPSIWRGRSFDLSDPLKAPFHLRVERQLTFGFPKNSAALFLIRLSFIDGRDILKNPLWRKNMILALHSMTPESRVYKGVERCFDQLVEWLETGDVK
jgi:hypothetical protein